MREYSNQILNYNSTSRAVNIRSILSTTSKAATISAFILGIMTSLNIKIVGYNVPSVSVVNEPELLFVSQLFIFLLIINIDIYYSRYINYIVDSKTGNCIDVIIYICCLLAGMISYIKSTYWLVTIMIVYFTVLIKNIQLSFQLPKDAPLKDRVVNEWVPNCVNHCIALCLFSILYYTLTSTYTINLIVNLFNLAPTSFEYSSLKVFAKLIKFDFALMFLFYWTHRMFFKKRVVSNPKFSFEIHEKYLDEVEHTQMKKDSVSNV